MLFWNKSESIKGEMEEWLNTSTKDRFRLCLMTVLAPDEKPASSCVGAILRVK